MLVSTVLAAALLACPGEVSESAGWKCVRQEAGKPVYIEKPMAVSYEECLRINRISELLGYRPDEMPEEAFFAFQMFHFH